MFSFKKGRRADIETYRDITDDVDESDFTPYACLFNPHTIVTKNGELLQTIRITGAERESIGSDDTDLRSAIRAAVREHTPSDSYAYWFHTIRRKKDLSSPGEFKDEFARKVDIAWEERNLFKRQFQNEVYVTVVREGQDMSLKNYEVLKKAIIPSRDIAWRNQFLDNISEELESVVDNILDSLSDYGAHRLTVYEEDGVYYSQSLEFLEKIINLSDRKMPVAEVDLSHYLTSGEITFSFNAMEVRSENNKRRFASIITVKEYKESSLEAIDRFLHAPIEFIATQCVDFINPKIALSKYEHQKKLTSISGDMELAKSIELDAILESNRGSIIDFGQQQLSIFIQADSLKQLESYTRKAMEFLAKYGIISIREDIRFEKCYWAQLPGNFEFIDRLMPTYTNHLGGFANLHNNPIGSVSGNHWGYAVSTFHTAAGTPYHFNFHVGENGHTFIAGPYGTGKSVLINFLLCQATKFSPRIAYFDISGVVSAFIGALNGEVYHLSASKEGMSAAINPFYLPDSEQNRKFLAKWIGVLARFGGEGQLPDGNVQVIPAAIAHIYEQPETKRSFAAFMEYLKSSSPEIAALYKAWDVGGKYGHILNNADGKYITVDKQYFGYDLRATIKEQGVFVPVISYLLQLVSTTLDGRPTIIALDEAWQLLSNTHIAMDVQGWLDKLTASNAMGIFSTEYIDDAAMSDVTKALVKGAATYIYLPNSDPSRAYEDVYGLNELERTYVSAMDTAERHFMIKQKNVSIVATLDLGGMDDILSVLSGASENDELMADVA